MQKWIYPLLIAFVAFFIFSNPFSAGTEGRQFVDWIGDGFSAVGTFLDGLFDDDGNPATPDNSGTGANTQGVTPSDDNSSFIGPADGTGAADNGSATDGGSVTEPGGGSSSGDSFDSMASPVALS